MQNNQVKTQFLINELINSASIMYSEFPIRASRARARVQDLKEELLKHIEVIQNQSKNLPT